MEDQTSRKTGQVIDVGILAKQALQPERTDTILLQYGQLFTDICARWIQSGSESSTPIAAFGRILPFIPHLAEHAEYFLSHISDLPLIRSPSSLSSGSLLRSTKESDIIEILLGIFRLLSFDCKNFAKYIRPLEIKALSQHSDRVVQYLAIRIFSLYVHAADHATQEMIKRYVGEDSIDGLWEGRTIDYRFLSLWEEQRWKNLQDQLTENEKHHDFRPKDLTSHTLDINGILLPRLHGISTLERPADLISTSTTERNLRSLAEGLLNSSPLLLTGLAGSGKTLLVRHMASQLNKLDKMVTLHLNEQSDAKLLIGMYATGAKPGTFSWRPGVLTTAVREGRWIFAEDLDRAPNEVISIFLPLIERGEMLIPSRGETVRAAEGFRIIATMTTTLNLKGQEIIPRQNMIGHRLWSSISIQMPHLLELRQIISAKYSVLQQHLSGILGVYSRLLNLYSDARFLSENGLSIRAITPRDLFKWCDRIATLLARSPTFSVAQKDDVFMEALDCFAGSIRNETLRLKIMSCVAEELHTDPQRRDFLLTSRTVQLALPAKDTASGVIRIGRAKLPRHKSSRLTTSRRPFSTNDSTLRLLESISVAVDRKEPLLLVGETGTGKTTCIQYLAEQLGRKLVVFNLSQQSESGDLLGGFKPVNVRSLVIPLKDEFDEIFDTTFSRKKNLRFLEMLGKRVAKGEWNRVCTLWREALKMVDGARKARESKASTLDGEDSQPKKKRKTESLPATFPAARWEKFAADLHDLQAQLSSGSEAFAFSFLEGNIVKAVRNGDWILLDEINLASSDTLEALTDLFSGGSDGSPSILLTETGNVERLVAHPNFRVFAAMNPATDVGKKDLPPGVRSRFTELYVESPDSNEKSLCNIVEKYLAGGNGNADSNVLRISRDVTKLYLEIQQLAKANMLVDGADQKPHFSLRTLTRTLSYAREVAPLCSLRRALYEGFHMSFLTFLAKSSEDLVTPLITKYLFPEKAILKAELGKPLQHPADTRHYVRQGHYWLRQGLHAVEEQPHYIITPFVQRNMNNLMRAASTRKYPVLIQGPTSSGKTSMIEYLAKRSGNKFVRINNHEHTDLQEYLGSYISGLDGKLSFQEGILVRALREGHWIVLDELNLAPTDVLEALNRLLDDNRELLIPETQEVVRPHEDFMLFATQNPAGLYGGRKVLSRAFRNRFLELHFDDIPVEELTEILHRRTMIPESWCKRIVKVYRELSILRQENRIFEQKSFATLRDLFRWAQRKADTIQDLANNGYMLLAERVRKEEERLAIKRIVETVMSERGPKVVINEDELFNTGNWLTSVELSNGDTTESAGVVWTRAMRRLFVLVAHALRNNEPVLLVGETGCGKTTVCQLLADHFQNQLHIVNAHQNTETGDLIGAQRPIRNRTAIEESLREQILEILRTFEDQNDISSLSTNQLLEQYDKLQQGIPEISSGPAGQLLERTRIQATALFEWADGSLVQAMKEGHYFLLDEISLADDSVLERLNSVLESSRTLLLAEKGPNDSLVTATEGFQFLATMNPGGDYGKKELSPALRNRFTEIWVPPMTDVEDILQIVRSKLKPNMAQYADAIIAFSQWFNDKYNTSVTSSISIRDTLSWVSFVNKTEHHIPVFSIVHGAAMVFIDTLGANPAGLLAIAASSINDERRGCLRHLSELIGQEVEPLYFGEITISSTDQMFQLGEFAVPKLDSATVTGDSSFFLDAPTTRVNAMRVLRALQLDKPILLEGNPGVGKSTLVTALAKLVGKNLIRLNLSEQTDLMDLFGSDVPVEGGAAGTFAWRDAPFLQAMKNGDWVLLDEMNLASQSILEGLNAVLDHRGEVYISELDQKFHKHENFRVFAAQNPHHQGGGRKGLPASFVNRFTVVYADVFSSDDLEIICQKVFSRIEREEITKLIRFVAELDEQVTSRRAFGNLGAPWEFNLRDTLRWLQLLASSKYPGSARDFLDTIFVQRMRTESDRDQLQDLFLKLYGSHEPRITHYHSISTQLLQVGLGVLPRDNTVTRPDAVSSPSINQLAPLEAMLVSVEQNWPMIIVGSSGSGKTTLINKLASFVGARLITFSMNPDIDAMDLVGGYEQVDPLRALHQCKERLEDVSRRRVASMTEPLEAYIELLERLQSSTAEVLDILHPMLELVERSDHEIFIVLRDFQVLSQSSSNQIDGARFQWVDGILVRALEQGHWLVLDNANLCSSAVLDRLNALLEPNGYLSINEHSMANGEAQIVRPHPGFRIFMTVDPSYGELSRAMRNRAVEICLLPSAKDHIQSHEPIVQYPLDSTMYRFRQFQKNSSKATNTIQQDFENLGPSDMKLLRSFEKQIQGGLASFKTSTYVNGTTTQSNEQLNGITPMPQGSKSNHLDFANFLSNEWVSHKYDPHHQTSKADLVQLSTCHPLGNELLLHQNQDSKALGIWRFSMYEIMLELHEMQSAVQNLPFAKFERLKEKQKLPSFLHEYVQVFSHFVQAVWAAHRESQQFDVTFLKPLRILFWEFLSLATGSTFDRAALRTYLNMLASTINTMMSNAGSIQQHLKDSLSKKVAVFRSNIQLTTGLGMERMWRTFKPVTPTSHHQFSALIELENTADRLDTIMWKSDLALEDMVQIRERMIASLDLLRKDKADATELLLSLGSAVDEFEKSVEQPTPVTKPYFEEEFEGFCQFLDIASIDSDMKYSIDSNATVAVRARSALLARRPTKLRSFGSDLKGNSTVLFSKLSRHLGLTSRLGTLCVAQNLYHTGLIAKLYQADEVQLVQLDCFEKELQVLSQGLSLDASSIMQGQSEKLGEMYQQIYHQLCSSHGDIIQSLDQGNVTFQAETHIIESYRLTLQQGFASSYRSTGTIDARAWVKLGLFGLCLYVSNYPFDPALSPMLERQMFIKTRHSMLNTLDLLRQFQIGFTGQETSFRIRLIEEAIQDLGDEPPVPAIIRPEVSQLEDLQGEFSNLLSVINPIIHGTMSIEDTYHDATLKSNVLRIIQRLTENYREYDDITDTVVGFLLCLSIGLVLGRKEADSKEPCAASTSLKYISSITLLFGRQKAVETAECVFQELEQGLVQHGRPIDSRQHAVHSLSVLKKVDPVSMKSYAARSLLHSLFASFYSDWKTKLLQDQEKQAQNSSMYTYRGMEDDTAEEDRDLFPDYEADQEEKPSSSVQEFHARDHVIKIATIHAELFVQEYGESDSIQALLSWCTKEMNRLRLDKGSSISYDDAMPAIFFMLNQKIDALTSSVDGQAYNFYFDANLTEAKIMMKLIHRIQIRYRHIRNTWPEHATLSEVLRTCDEALEFRHVDPVAKFITKAEKLHEYMSEWQKVASKEYSTADLYDDLTKLLISWRQLELTTWAKLFDMEVDKCRKDAQSWFFIAYELIIAASESVEEGTDLTIHATKLVQSLEVFFESTTIGQFEQRVKLLRQLCQHAAMRMQDAKVFKTIFAALDNFIAYISRFEQPVREALATGRQGLEREVKDVIKLASWKDTNIDALKQSAKTSHRKLSKLVRKFRALLNQSVSKTLQSEIPNSSHIKQDTVLGTIDTVIDTKVLELCENGVPAWSNQPSRFKNLNATVSLMRTLSTPRSDTIDGALRIDDFVRELSSSIIELQKATPSTLTEDNKETVQHLKTQKRKLYADTMKELRHMGIVSNLSMDLLVKQDSLSTILSTLPLLSQNVEAGRSAASSLHNVLNIMPRVRAVYKEHSGDLMPNDVAKSIGYLEGLLHRCLRQRAILSRALHSFETIRSPMMLISSVYQCAEDELSWTTKEQWNSTRALQPKIRWLATVLKTGTDIVCAQAKMGKTNQLTNLIREMREWTTKLQSLADSFDRLPKLPMNIQSESHKTWDESVQTTISQFRSTFVEWVDKNEMSRTVLRQIKPFLFEYTQAMIGTSFKVDLPIESHTRSILESLDLVLGSMQDVSTALKELPASADDSTWLIKEEDAFSSALNRLHSSQISRALQTVLENLQQTSSSDVQIVAAFLASKRPIFDQYVASYKYLVDRFDALHASTTSLLLQLSKSFVQIGTQGFCQPPEKSSDQEKGKDEKLESGTGLGEGEGAEDISKDINDQDDLEDLAQEKGGEREGSIEEEDDAVDMGEQDLEGETGERAEKEDKGDESGEEGDTDVQSEVGSVDDLGPSAVDEKMWDEGGEDEDDAKDREGKGDVGTEDQKQEAAAEQKEKEKKDDQGDKEDKEDQEGVQEAEMEMEGEDQEENVGIGEREQLDPHTKEEETLDLPEDLNMDGQNDEGKEKDDFGDMDMDDDLPEEELDQNIEPNLPDNHDEELGNEQDADKEEETTGHTEADEEANEDQDDGSEDAMDEQAVPLPDDNAPDQEQQDMKDTEQSAEVGAGADANDEAHQQKSEQKSANAANQDEGQEGEPSETEKRQEAPAEDGSLGQKTQPDMRGHGEEPEASREIPAFKKLGDMLEKWYNQQKQISEAREKDETQVQQIDKEVDMADADFEHLGDEEEQADTQALGTATEEQAKALDHDMALPMNEEEEKLPARPEDHEDPAGADEDVQMEDSNAAQDHDQKEDQSKSDGNNGAEKAFIGDPSSAFDQDQDEDMEDAISLVDEPSETSSVHEVETQLEFTHLDSSVMDSGTARNLWLSHEAATHSLSQQLTEHLRLILAPTLATKLRGDFRTGKRLNLKRIIPYIASGYKRDKIWLRRSQPSKRSYQVMIALDDSKSMAESGASNLALKTLTLVTKSLSMLEVGEVSVVGFGDQINVAHDFDKPFTSEAGVKVFEQFGFDAAKTNVRGLVERSLELFGEARRKGSSSPSDNLWQLMLIVSDGICDSHAEIQRLVRKAQEERVMIVFIIIDSSTPKTSTGSAPSTSSATASAQGPAEKETASILDLQSVEITPEGKVVRWKYMERFPFRYYLLVRDVRELPGVLAGALRQWFGEVAGTV